MESSKEVLQKIEIELPYDLAVPLLGVYPKEINQYLEDTCSPLFIVALFTIAKIWKPLNCLLVDERIKCDTHKYYLAVKKETNLPFATTWMNTEDIMLSE